MRAILLSLLLAMACPAMPWAAPAPFHHRPADEPVRYVGTWDGESCEVWLSPGRGMSLRRGKATTTATISGGAADCFDWTVLDVPRLPVMRWRGTAWSQGYMGGYGWAREFDLRRVKGK